MSPEILSGTMDFARFVSYAESDIYSVSLVLWEIFACCTVNGKWYRYACVCVCGRPSSHCNIVYEPTHTSV